MTHTTLVRHTVTNQCLALSRVMEVIDIAAAGRINLLIAGKPDAACVMVARAVHGRGSYRNGPFVSVDCSRPRAADLKWELFGTLTRDAEAGPTTGDAREPLARESRLYRASRGTLFLQHFAAMPPAVQARLSRLLKQREAVVGPEQQRVSLDIHIIAAADPGVDRDEARVQADLYEDVSALRIELPSLAIEPADVPALAVHLLEDICRRAKVAPKKLTSLAQILLGVIAHQCNVLELWLLLEELVTRVPGRVIRIEDIGANVLLDGPLGFWTTTASLREAREQFERKYIAAVIERHRGRIPQAACALGMERTNLYRKLRHLDVEPIAFRAPKRP